MFEHLLDKEEESAVFAGLEPSAVLKIDLDAIAHNYRSLLKKVGPACRVAAMVKANAYGMGARRVASVLVDEGCNTLFTANAEEALELYAHFRDTDREMPALVVLNGVLPGMEQVFAASGLIPVLNSLDQITNYTSIARRIGRELPCYLHFDTGMNRLGLDAQETLYVLTKPEILRGLDVRCIMSHLACADEVGHEKTFEQFMKFEDIQKQLPERISKTCHLSLANSSGIFRGPDLHFSMVRPGMALYGLNPTPETDNPMKPVVSLKTKILQTRICNGGDTIGYGATHAIEQPTPIVTIAAGYADGMHRLLSNKAKIYIDGIACPVVGRVSMDLIGVDITPLTEKPPRMGDWVEIIGDNQSADDLAAQAGTIGYEMLTSIGNTPAKRLRRDYKSVQLRAWNVAGQRKAG